MKKTILLFILLAIVALSVTGQTVQLTAPPLAGKEAKLYYFKGAETDSLQTVIDASGKAELTIPRKNYVGMVMLIVPNAGGVEMVVAEPKVLVECHSEMLNNQTAEFPQSEENHFLAYIFTTQTLYMQQQAWLKAGEELFTDSSPLLAALQTELKKVENAMSALEKEIKDSKLYAAKYYRLSDFMNRLYTAEQQRDVKAAKSLRQEVENNLDIGTLYTSGRLWNSIPNFYISLFNQTHNSVANEREYAASILKTTERLTDPYLDAFIAGAITETERFGWQKAQSSIIGGLLTRFKGFTSSYPIVQRAIGAYQVSQGKQLPPIVGLTKNDKPYEKILVAFHDSDCITCTNEMIRLKQLYPALKEKNIRVASVAADVDKKRYEEETKSFPWKDKICDLKGFSGVNFLNYNVIGSPAFYLTDIEGKLLGMYFNVADLEKDL